MNNKSTSNEAPSWGRRSPLGARPDDFRAKFQEALPEWPAQIQPFCVSTEWLDDEIMAAFHEEMKSKLAALRAAMTPWAFDTIAALAHSIKGMAGSCGAPEISLLALRIEEAARAKDENGCVRWARLFDYWEPA